MVGRTILVHVRASDSIRHVKLKIKDELHIGPDRQRLIFEGQELEDRFSLAHYHIQNGSTLLFRVERLRGGAKTKR